MGKRQKKIDEGDLETEALLQVRKKKNAKKLAKKRKRLEKMLAFQLQKSQSTATQPELEIHANEDPEEQEADTTEDEVYPRRKTTRLQIRLDQCQVKYFDKKQKLK